MLIILISVYILVPILLPFNQFSRPDKISVTEAYIVLANTSALILIFILYKSAKVYIFEYE